jgi:rare lipoprotein A
LAVLVSFLVGCASPVNRGGAAKPVPSSGRDGAPADPPADLASLPDPEPQVEPIRRGGPNKPYVVLGQAYEPVAADVPWKERGVASWYGTKFHGRKTASGELFSMYGLTAAHRTLPIPSYARVRHVGNGKEIIVRVNDRGPFHSSRVLDLSFAAAVKLGISSAGSALVEIERLTFDDIRSGSWRKPPEMMTPEGDPIADIAAKAVDEPVEPEAMQSGDRARAFTPAAQGYWVQLAAFSRRDSVDRMQQRVAVDAVAMAPMMAVFKEGTVYKLQVGPYATRQQADEAARGVRESMQVVPMVIERR